jgi:hypothetical protein
MSYDYWNDRQWVNEMNRQSDAAYAAQVNQQALIEARNRAVVNQANSQANPYRSAPPQQEVAPKLNKKLLLI